MTTCISGASPHSLSLRCPHGARITSISRPPSPSPSTKGSFHRFAAPLFILLILAGCKSLPVPELGAIYSEAASQHGPGDNPIIVIPGILGSRLEDSATGHIVWGAFGDGALSPNSPEGFQLNAHPMGSGPLAALQDSIIAPAALDSAKLRLLGLPVTLSAYASLLGTLGAGGYLDESFKTVEYGDDHYTCFQFPYDWRRDNIENARLLHAFILAKKKEVEAGNLRRFGRSGAPVKFDIVAHSMGGLITRYMLMYGDQEPAADGAPPSLTWEGARNVAKVLLVATPNDGSLMALQQLTDGFRPAPILARYSPALLGTMPAIYQLLPDPKLQPVLKEPGGQSLDYLEIATWEEFGWGLASPRAASELKRLFPAGTDPAKIAKIAHTHLAKCLDRAKAFRTALARHQSLPEGLSLQIYAGDAIATPSTLRVAANGKLSIAASSPGDGTVLRSSALLDTRTPAEQGEPIRSPIPWSRVSFLHKDHIGLTQDPSFADNILYQLLLAPHP